MITRLSIRNFCAFKELDINFSPKINVIIGENSFGKTQLLKAAYVLGKVGEDISKASRVTKPQVGSWLTKKLLSTYKPNTSKLYELYHRGGKGPASIQIEQSSGQRFGATFPGRGTKAQPLEDYKQGSMSGVFIPTREVLTLLPGISKGIAGPDVLDSLFDDSVIDLCRSLLLEVSDDFQARVDDDPRLGDILPALVNDIKGRYEITKEYQSFVPGKYQEVKAKPISQSKQAKAYSDATMTLFVPQGGAALSNSMTAEGYRKIGILQGLLRNGVIDLGISGPLYWDEPESNMNPVLMRLIVESLFKLSRNGQQVILATHDYVLLKWLDLLMDKDKEDHVRFHVLKPLASGVSVESVDSYNAIPEHAISSTFSELYDEEIKRSLKAES